MKYIKQLRDWANDKEQACIVIIDEGCATYPEIRNPKQMEFYNSIYRACSKIVGPNPQRQMNEDIARIMQEEMKKEINKELISLLEKKGKYDVKQKSIQTDCS